VLAIKHLADRAAQVVFADFGAFMLERTIRSLIDPDEDEELVLADRGESHHPTRRLDYSVEKLIARGDERRCGKVARLVDLEMRLSSSHCINNLC